MIVRIMEALIEKDPDLKHLSRGKLYIVARQRAGLGKKEVDAYLEKERDGRRNRYRVVRDSHFRHDLESGVTLGAFVDLVTSSSAPANV